jgi:outer membrane protein
MHLRILIEIVQKRLQIKYSILMLLLLQAAVSFAQTKEYSLNELVNIAFQNNPQLKANEKNIQAGMKQIDYLNKEYLPQIFFDLNFSRWDWVMPNKQKYVGNSLYDFYADLRVNQLIYDWNKNSIQKDYANKSFDIDRNFTRKLKQAFSYSIAKSYLELSKAKRTVAIQDEAINQLREHLKNAEALYSIGNVSSLDVIKAKVQIEVALDELAKAKNQLDVQKNNINVVCGNTLGDSFNVVDNIDDLWNQYSNKSYSLVELKNILAANHPDLENIRTQKELRSKEAELFNKEYYPNLYAFGITNVEDSQIPMGNFNWNVGVTVSYSLPFFKGSNFEEKVEQSKVRIDALQENENGVMQQLEANVKNNLLKLDDYKSRLSGSKKIVKLAEESLIAANLKYNIGKGNSLDVLDAETVLTTAKLNYNQIVIDLLSAIAELNYNIGSDELPFKK